MSRTIATAIRTFALATLTLAGATACDEDPITPVDDTGSHHSMGAKPAAGKDKPTLYFNGILFAGTHDGTSVEIYSIWPDGSSLFRLTTDDVTDVQPDVSPIGPYFIWTRYSGNDQTSEIYRQNLDGSKRKRLTYLNTYALHPRYSPDGMKIAFTAMVPGDGAEIFTMNADGTGIARVTTSANNSQFPSWSPDGSMIAFQSTGSNGHPGVWVMYASGGGQKLLADCPAPGCTRPMWSPVANEIAVENSDGSGIFVIDATTGVQTAWIPPAPPAYDIMPTWSEDGLRIIFSSLRGNNGTYDLFSTEPVRAGATSPTSPPPVVRLTSLPGEEFTPAYSH